MGAHGWGHCEVYQCPCGISPVEEAHSQEICSGVQQKPLADRYSAE